MKLNIIHKNSVLPADTFGMNQCKKTKYYNEGKTNPKTFCHLCLGALKLSPKD